MTENLTRYQEVNYTINELLVYLEFSSSDIILYQFAMPILGLIGLCFCSISAWIFFKFNMPIYEYYRFMTVVYSIDMAFAIPYGFCFTPTYLPDTNSYACAIVQSVYIPYVSYAFHVIGVIEIAILLSRMSIFSHFLDKYFVIRPKIFCAIATAFCLFVDGFTACVYLPVYGGDYYYYDKTGSVKYNSFYYVDTSEIAQSQIGSIVLVAIYVIRDYLTMAISATLSIISLVQMRKYFKNKIIKFKLFDPNKAQHVNGNRDANKKNRLAERNHLKMVISLTCISIVSRSISMTCDLLYLFVSGTIAPLFGTLTDMFFIIGPAFSIFVFLNFDANFKKEFCKMFFNRLEQNSEINAVCNLRNN